MNKQVISTALLALCLSAGQAKISLAQEDGPIQAPIDGGAPTTPAANPQNPDAAPILNLVPRAADQYSDAEIKALGQGPAFPYSSLESALIVAVNEKGAVNYNKLQLNNDLNLFVRAVGLADMTQFPVFKITDEDGRTKEDKKSELTFWINAYNGLFLKAVATGYPVKQLSQIKDLQTAQRLIGGKNYTFPQLRDKIGAMDPRAAFALVDATVYGPRVQQVAYRYYDLGRELNDTVKGFIADPVRVPMPDRLGKVLTISPWMQSVDSYFKGGPNKRKWGGLQNVLTAYAPNSASKNYFGSGDYEIQFFPANDTINDENNAL